MEIRRFYLACLAHASYLVYDGGEAAVIDPQRDIGLYLEEAAALGVRIRWVIETHLHADFISGHTELAARSGATICIGAEAGATFPHRDLRDGDELELGAAKLRVMETPGHTLESICVVAMENAQPVAAFTGDTLFIGDVGRPDLSPTKTPQELAAMLFDSLHQKVLTLPDETVVYPAHGAGSLCGRQMSSEANSTIGRERKLNYALQPKDRDEFVHLLTAEMPPRPGYFQDEVARNREGAPALDALTPLRQMTPNEVQAAQEDGATVLDTRTAGEFGAAHVPGAVHIGLRGQFASWAARLLGLDRKIVLVAEEDAALDEARMRLARVGIEHVIGSLAGGMLAWADAGLQPNEITQVPVRDAAREIAHPAVTLLDVREGNERETRGAVVGAQWIPLGSLQSRLAELDSEKTLLVMCQGGYRSSIAASLLAGHGFPHVGNVVGGFDAWAIAFPEVAKAPACTAAR
ncbi:MAG TPA: MBL fold metallo-hydrolase [Terracidiphilus sp.]|jgi:glyoxylase-like metal-dependent hydrolase (beta-lactamase superfamily II)